MNTSFFSLSLGFIALFIWVWLIVTTTVPQVLQAALGVSMTTALLLLPLVTILCFWLAHQTRSQLPVKQQARETEKVTIANEHAIMQIEALEAKIQTLETALSKALTSQS